MTPPTSSLPSPVRSSTASATAPTFGPHVGAVVLVHGAWVGEWCWAPVLPLLRSTGREVHTVALRGLGVRRADAGAHITLDTHVADLVDLVETWDLVDVVLAAHSYGGRVVTAALSTLSSRVAHVVYLDAHAPIGPPPTSDGPGDAPGGPTDIVPFGEFPPDPDELGSPEAVAWFLERTSPQPAATLRAPWWTTIPDHIGRTYVHATGGGPSRFASYASAARDDPSWRYVEIACSHWLMIARPAEVAAIIGSATGATANDSTTANDRSIRAARDTARRESVP